MSVLPDTWLDCTLGDVINYGATKKAEPSEIPDEAWVLELEDIEKNTSKILQRLTFRQRQSKSSKNQFLAGDVLYGKLRPYLNKVVRADQDGYCTTEIIPIRPTEIVEGAYLFYWLKTPTFIDYVTSVSHGLNMPRLGTAAGKQAPFVLAPLPEQKRIAGKLDAVLARIDDCRSHLDQIPAILKRFRQSVLAAATSGRLAEEWRVVQSGHENEWPTVSVASVAETVFDGPFGSHLKTADYSEDGVRVVRLENIGSLQFLSDKKTYIPEEKYADLYRHTLQGGDVLFSSFVDEEVRVCIFPSNLETKSINKADVFCIRTKSTVCDSRFLAIRLACRTTYMALREQVHGATRPRINLKQLRSFEFQLPALDEQIEIVRRVESLLAWADRIEARYSTARSQIERFTPSLLAKAYRGELVPQEPNDGLASTLLERVRATTHGKEKQKNKSRKAPMTKPSIDSVKAIIQKMPQVRFSFDELSNQVSADYETTKNIVFALLSESDPLLRQVFDKEAQAMCFEKVLR